MERSIASVPPGRPRAALRAALLVAAVTLLVLGLEAEGVVDREGWSSLRASLAEDGLRDPRWLGLAALYVLAMALPFVPAIELGVALMLVLGPGGVLAVYLCTQLALALGFAIGRRLPPPAAAFEERLQARLPRRWRRVLRHRHLSLAILLNLPGNGVLGGAGGIALLAGASRVYGPLGFALTVAAGTTPIPLAILLGVWS